MLRADFTVQSRHSNSPDHAILHQGRTYIRSSAALSLLGGGKRLSMLEKWRYRREYNNDSKTSNHRERRFIMPPRGR